jgi:hypothetical protein
MADESWNVQIGELDDRSDPGAPPVPPVPTTVYEGDEQGARDAYDEWSSKATDQGYRYVMLRHIGEVLECWGTPPAVG